MLDDATGSQMSSSPHAPVIVNFTTPGAPSGGPSNISSAPAQQPTSAAHGGDDVAEQRIKYFQSKADRTEAELAKAQAEVEAMKAAQAAQMAGVQAAVAAANSQAEAAMKLAQEVNAQRLRAEALLARPHLKDYISLLPLTNDPAQLEQHLAQLEQIHQGQQAKIRTQLEAELAQKPPAASVTASQLVAAYPPQTYPGAGLNGGSPTSAFTPATPSTVPAAVAGSSVAEQIQARLMQAQAESRQQQNPMIFERALAEVQQMAAADAHRQAGL